MLNNLSVASLILAPRFTRNPLVAFQRLTLYSSILLNNLSFILSTNPPPLRLPSLSFSPNKYFLKDSDDERNPKADPNTILPNKPKGPANNPKTPPVIVGPAASFNLSCTSFEIKPPFLSLVSSSISPNKKFLALSEDFTKPTDAPIIAPIIGEPVSVPIIPPIPAPFPILGVYFLITSDTFFGSRPFLYSPFSSSLPKSKS